jgi:branched-chain amino acid transport system permease protein
MTLIGQLVFDGMAMGLVFVLLAVGLVLITSVNKILFMSYGMFYTVAAYATWYFIDSFHLPYVISLIVSIALVAALGALFFVLVFQRLVHHEGGFLETLIASMGLLIILQKANLLVFGPMPHKIPTVFPGIITVFGISMAVAKIMLIIIGVFITIALFLIYEKTKLGRAMRTVAFLPEYAPLAGINIDRIYLITMIIGIALAGIAGGILAPTYGISPGMGANILWTVMLMTMLGGMDSMPGAVLGGIVIGQLLSFGQYFIGSVIQVYIFIIIGIILYFRPNGLLGRGINIET